MKTPKKFCCMLAGALLFSCLASVPAGAACYTLDADGNRIPITKTYQHVGNISSMGEKYEDLLNPSDLFIDDWDNLYIVDTGHNRIFKTDLEGNILFCYDEEAGYEFNKPQGIYVDDTGDMYVSDTDNNRIVHLSPEGELVEEFIKPSSELLDANSTFSPTKLGIGPTGYIYVTMFENLITMDAFNQFRGFLGQTKVPFSFVNLLIRLFASEEQKQKVTRPTAAPITNIFIDDEGMIYCTSKDNLYGEIKKFNHVGTNIYPVQTYGEYTYDGTAPSFVDLTVDKAGIVTAIDDNTAKIYQYDQAGNLLTVFGGKGESNGYFQKPSSIEVDSKGNLYVLDFAACMIQIFSPTDFLVMVQQATAYNQNAEYDKALSVWQEIQTINRNYPLANEGIAKALYKQGDYKASMDYYEKAGNKEGYSEAYQEYRTQMFRKNFGWGVLAIVAAITLLVLYIRLLRRISRKILAKYFSYRRDTDA